jgi:hypothetical protein
MSYAIGNVGYGFSIPHHILEQDSSLVEIIEPADGVFRYYSAGGVMPMFIGVEIAKIDECQDVDLEELLRKFTLSTFVYHSQANRLAAHIIDFVKNDSEYETSSVLKEFVEYLENNRPKKIIVWSNS